MTTQSMDLPMWPDSPIDWDFGAVAKLAASGYRPDRFCVGRKFKSLMVPVGGAAHVALLRARAARSTGLYARAVGDLDRHSRDDGASPVALKPGVLNHLEKRP